MNSRKIDLNLYAVLDAIYKERNLTRAGEKLHLSQPAISHALRRLREHFNDPLFNRRGKEMQPTALTHKIIPELSTALDALKKVSQTDSDFDPKTSNRTFTIACHSNLEPLVLPIAYKFLHNTAPNIHLNSIQIPRNNIVKSLSRGDIDFALDAYLNIEKNIERTTIIEEKLTVILRKNHPLLKQEWDLEAYLSAKHIQLSKRHKGQSIEDVELDHIGKQRNVLIRCQNFLTATELLKGSDLLLTMPGSFIVTPAYKNQLTTLSVPFKADPLKSYIYSLKDADSDPALLWFKTSMLKNISKHFLIK